MAILKPIRAVTKGQSLDNNQRKDSAANARLLGDVAVQRKLAYKIDPSSPDRQLRQSNDVKYLKYQA